MAYDEHTAERFRAALGPRPDITEKKMMGGICFLVNGNMVGGADRTKDGQRRLMFRVGKDNHAAAGELPGGQRMMQGGRLMSGFFFVDEASCDDATLNAWLALAMSFAQSLPPK
ncbi:MAG: TfoX/Sxy family protein [Hyphomicrobiales bacterium]|nr:TfoX/Sxy family protein [Hyphomicrobiales bacterium]